MRRLIAAAKMTVCQRILTEKRQNLVFYADSNVGTAVDKDVVLINL